MTRHWFVGFGFGPIQAGLFAYEAFASRQFERIVIAEVDSRLVDAVRRAGGAYWVNIAGADRIDRRQVEGIEIVNPNDPADQPLLAEALAGATEICTSLPSVSFYTTGAPSVADWIAQGLTATKAPATIIYTAENNNHAAEILQTAVHAKCPSLGRPTQFLNTVIGKMSQVVSDPHYIAQKNLEPIVPGFPRAFLVEAFNKILVTQCQLKDFQPGISVFIEKPDLLPFEEAKLYGHNAIHALLAYLAARRGLRSMAQLPTQPDLMAIGRRAFIEQAGAALCAKYATLGDRLFTPTGFREYAEDLLARMTNPQLDDAVERAARDPVRKLGISDRLYGTMALCLQYGIQPVDLAVGAAAGLWYLLKTADRLGWPSSLAALDADHLTDAQIEALLRWIWQKETPTHPWAEPMIKLTQAAWRQLH